MLIYKNPVRILVCGADFWSEIRRSGPWSRFWSGFKPGPAYATDFGPIKPYQGGFFGPVFDPENFVRKIENPDRSIIHEISIRTGSNKNSD